MKRFALAVSAIVVAVVVSSCAVGVRGPATEVGKTSATLNGKVLSTTGGPGSWFIEYGTTAARTEKTPTRTIDFVANESRSVAEPVDGLEQGTTYHYAVCAEDGENPGDPFCSPDQTFKTDFDPADYHPTLTVESACGPLPHNTNTVRVAISGLPPNRDFTGTLEFPGGGSGTATIRADANGAFEDFFEDGMAGTWTATVQWAGGTLVESAYVAC